MSIRVFIYDDNHARRDSLKSLIELSPDFLFLWRGRELYAGGSGYAKSIS